MARKKVKKKVVSKSEMKRVEFMKADEKVGITVSTEKFVKLTTSNGELIDVALKVDRDTNQDWVTTGQDAHLDNLVMLPYEEFSLIQDHDADIVFPNKTSIGGEMIKEGDILQVQFPKGSHVVELTAHLSKEGYAVHRSWWAGVAVEIPLTGCYGRKV